MSGMNFIPSSQLLPFAIIDVAVTMQITVFNFPTTQTLIDSSCYHFQFTNTHRNTNNSTIFYLISVMRRFVGLQFIHFEFKSALTFFRLEITIVIKKKSIHLNGAIKE